MKDTCSRYLRAVKYQNFRRLAEEGRAWWELGIDHPYIAPGVLREMMGIPSEEESILPHSMIDDPEVFARGNPEYTMDVRARSDSQEGGGKRKRDERGRFTRGDAGIVVREDEKASDCEEPIPEGEMRRTLARQLHAWASGTPIYDRHGYVHGIGIPSLGIGTGTPRPNWWADMVRSSTAGGGGVVDTTTSACPIARVPPASRLAPAVASRC